MPTYTLRAKKSPGGALSLVEVLDELIEHTEGRVRDGTRSAATLEMQRGHRAYWLAILGDIDVRALDEPALEDLARWMRGAGGAGGRPLAMTTVQKRFSTLRRAVRLAGRRRELERVPLFPEFPARPAGKPATPYFPSYEAFRRVRDELPLERRDWLDLAVWTGQHASDVERMAWADVHVGEGAECTVRIRNTKNRKPPLRVICPLPLVEALRAMEARVRAATGAAPHPTDRLVKPWPTRGYQLGRACVRAGIRPVNSNGCRHTAVTWMVRRKGLSVAAQEWFGWSSYRLMETVYAHATPAAFADAAAELGSVVNDNAAEDLGEKERPDT